ncbi:MAG: hypothetical protein GY849_02325 [Deltaproteobacteria bacterium]|nr:hypothetical protein [Deltaproteobacteria bacterium]
MQLKQLNYMILSYSEIIEKINNPTFKSIVELCKHEQLEHDRHVSGKDFKKLVEPLKGFENEDQKRVKHQLAQPATVSIVSEIKNTLNKWQSATDTFKEYNFSNTEQSKTFKTDILSKVWRGESMEYFVNYFLKDAMWNKFNDFLIVNRSFLSQKEFGKETLKLEIIDGVEKIYTDGKLTPYIANISIFDCWDFFINGNKVEYLIYKTNKTEDGQYFKVLDDYGVYTFLKKDNSKREDSIVEIKELFVKNEIKELACIRVSALKSIMFPKISTSLLYPVISKLNAYVNDYAIHCVSKIKHAYPQRYTVSAKCMFQDEKLQSSVCNGTGKIVISENDERKEIRCPKCKGSGRNRVENASQDFEVPFLLEEGQKAYTSEPIGYAKIDIGILEFQSKELEIAEKDIKEKTLNKNILLENSVQKTATAVIENSEPVIILNMFFAKLISYTEKKLTDWIGKLYSVQYQDCIINYGLNYANKNKDQITIEIEDGKRAGLSISEITKLHKNRIKSAYSKDNDEMLFQLMLDDLEPFSWLSTEEVEKSTTILPIDKMEKLYFIEYINELKDANQIDFEKLRNSDNYKSIYNSIKQKIKQLNQLKYDSSKNIQIREESSENSNINTGMGSVKTSDDRKSSS